LCEAFDIISFTY